MCPGMGEPTGFGWPGGETLVTELRPPDPLQRGRSGTGWGLHREQEQPGSEAEEQRGLRPMQCRGRHMRGVGDSLLPPPKGAGALLLEAAFPLSSQEVQAGTAL